MPDPSGPETPPAKRPTWRARLARFLATIEARVPPRPTRPSRRRADLRRGPPHLQQVDVYCYRWTVQTLTIPRSENLLRRERVRRTEFAGG